MVCTMKMMYTMSNEERRPLRRSYSAQLKLEIIGQCQASELMTDGEVTGGSGRQRNCKGLVGRNRGPECPAKR